MAQRKLIVKSSSIEKAGTGLFADEDIKAGSVVMIFSTDCFIISKTKYDSQQRNGNELMTQTGCRLIGDVFLYTDSKTRYDNYINHSFDANILYHAGICLAKKDINANDELTVDYRYILSEDDDYQFYDTLSGKLVKGYDGTTALLESTKELMALLKSGVKIV
jgi:hypothetical protein